MQFERFSDKIKRDKRTNGDVMVGVKLYIERREASCRKHELRTFVPLY